MHPALPFQHTIGYNPNSLMHTHLTLHVQSCKVIPLFGKRHWISEPTSFILGIKSWHYTHVHSSLLWYFATYGYIWHNPCIVSDFSIQHKVHSKPLRFARSCVSYNLDKCLTKWYTIQNSLIDLKITSHFTSYLFTFLIWLIVSIMYFSGSSMYFLVLL
jgi:hypothetical protein